jgi:hypothetical protein
MVRVLAPSRWMLFWMVCEAPSPKATSRITAATPMRMPSVVRKLRSLLADTPRSANRRISSRLTR